MNLRIARTQFRVRIFGTLYAIHLRDVGNSTDIRTWTIRIIFAIALAEILADPTLSS